VEDMREVLNTQGLPLTRPLLEDVVVVTKVVVTVLGLRLMLAHTPKEEARDEDEEPADVTTKNKKGF
jgi:hypothetical protein